MIIMWLIRYFMIEQQAIGVQICENMYLKSVYLRLQWQSKNVSYQSKLLIVQFEKKIAWVKFQPQRESRHPSLNCFVSDLNVPGQFLFFSPSSSSSFFSISGRAVGGRDAFLRATWRGFPGRQRLPFLLLLSAASSSVNPRETSTRSGSFEASHWLSN